MCSEYRKVSRIGFRCHSQIWIYTVPKDQHGVPFIFSPHHYSANIEGNISCSLDSSAGSIACQDHAYCPYAEEMDHINLTIYFRSNYIIETYYLNFRISDIGNDLKFELECSVVSQVVCQMFYIRQSSKHFITLIEISVIIQIPPACSQYNKQLFPAHGHYSSNLTTDLSQISY